MRLLFILKLIKKINIYKIILFVIIRNDVIGKKIIIITSYIYFLYKCKQIALYKT